MPHFLLTFGDASRPPVGAVILEAPSMHQARMTAVVRRLAPGVPFGEGLQLSAKMMTSLPPTLIGRMMPGAEAVELILQLVEGRRRPHPRFPPPLACHRARRIKTPAGCSRTRPGWR
jgi:hypothetical protein